jgi:two-component system response regulator RpfG
VIFHDWLPTGSFKAYDSRDKKICHDGEGKANRMVRPVLRSVNSEVPPETPDVERLPGSNFIMIVDDRKAARSLLVGLARSMEPGLHVESFADPRAALERALEYSPDLIISDYRMPEMDGVELTRRLRSVPHLVDVPIVIVTVVEDRSIRYQALEAGATDFLTRPIDPQECRARCRNLLALRLFRKATADRAQWLEERVLEATFEIRNREKETLLRLAKAGEFRDQETGYHIVRMAKFARLIAEELGLSALECDEIESSAPMHDIGKIGIADTILQKPGPLTPEEMEQMRQHTVIGHQLLAGSPSRYLQTGAIIALGHHERYDGNGYPYGLAGEAIPLQARVVAVADVFDALTSCRPYKKPWPLNQALDYIKSESGGHFDPDCAQAFLRRLDEVIQILESYRDPLNCGL